MMEYGKRPETGPAKVEDAADTPKKPDAPDTNQGVSDQPNSSLRDIAKEHVEQSSIDPANAKRLGGN